MNLHQACKSPDFEAAMMAKHTKHSRSPTLKKFRYWNQIAAMTDDSEIPESDRMDLY
jgi:hypothetical protein